jgi:hypothetical protein
MSALGPGSRRTSAMSHLLREDPWVRLLRTSARGSVWSASVRFALPVAVTDRAHDGADRDHRWGPYGGCARPDKSLRRAPSLTMNGRLHAGVLAEPAPIRDHPPHAEYTGGRRTVVSGGSPVVTVRSLGRWTGGGSSRSSGLTGRSRRPWRPSTPSRRGQPCARREESAWTGTSSADSTADASRGRRAPAKRAPTAGQARRSGCRWGRVLAHRLLRPCRKELP